MLSKLAEPSPIGDPWKRHARGPSPALRYLIDKSGTDGLSRAYWNSHLQFLTP